MQRLRVKQAILVAINVAASGVLFLATVEPAGMLAADDRVTVRKGGAAQSRSRSGR